MEPRFALYFAPVPGTPLHAFGSAWLGRDAETGETMAQPVLPRVPAETLRRVTASPRHYGFHATLKPPFALAPGRTADELRAAAASLAARQPPFRAPPLVLDSLGGFLALVPAGPALALHRLADAAVVDLDPFRAPASEAELARRRAAGLSEAERRHLDRWGYPYVLDTFRFHMTLTERLAGPEHEAVRDVLAGLAAPFADRPLAVDAVAIFRQESRDAPFRVVERLPLRG